MVTNQLVCIMLVVKRSCLIFPNYVDPVQFCYEVIKKLLRRLFRVLRLQIIERQIVRYVRRAKCVDEMSLDKTERLKHRKGNLLKNWHGRIKFVDDTTAFEIIPRGSPSMLPMVVDEISNFASIRGMQLNPKKCKEMIISFLKHNHTCFTPIFISGFPVEVVSTFKLLGVMLSNDLTWRVHVDFVLKKANSRLYALRKLRRAGLNQSNLVNVYCSLVRTCLEYASPSWASLSATLSEDIESLQRRALRIIYPELSYMDALVVSGLDTLANRRHECCMKFITKVRECKSDNNPLVNMVKEASYHPVHDYNLRNNNPIKLLNPRTERFKRFVTIKYN